MNRAGELTRSQITFSTTPLTLKGVILCIYMPMCFASSLFFVSYLFSFSIILKCSTHDCSCIDWMIQIYYFAYIYIYN